MFKAIRRRAWAPLVAIAAVIGAVAIAQAAIPDSSGTINGCYHKNSGDLRVVDNSASCSSTETALSWSQTGPQGPTGPQGTTGPQGPTGDSASGLFASYNEVSVPESGYPGHEIVGLSDLPAGTYLINALVQIQELHCILCGDPVIHCYFVDQNGEFSNEYTVVFGEAAHHAQAEFPLTAIRTFSGPPNTIRVKCYSPDDDGNAFANITAIKVTPLGVKP